MMGYQTCGYINCCNHSGEYPERIDDVAYRGVVAVLCAGLAPVIPQARRDVCSCVRTKPSPVVVDIRCLSSLAKVSFLACKTDGFGLPNERFCYAEGAFL